MICASEIRSLSSSFRLSGKDGILVGSVAGFMVVWLCVIRLSHTFFRPFCDFVFASGPRLSAYLVEFSIYCFSNLLPPTLVIVHNRYYFGVILQDQR